MVRAPFCEKLGLKKGPWTTEEDEILIAYINKHGHSNWRALPKLAGEFLIIFSHMAIISNLSCFSFNSFSLYRPSAMWEELQT